ncbi:hypothetical protein MNQ98_16780 [Paenibacillus sp. N3/727]|nr:hypothetical protein [Paenibacillus sp. N3/727]UNK16183.1 hypothetical protein MNQ98_16780 [Paenibacillus sp. N3/727]
MLRLIMLEQSEQEGNSGQSDVLMDEAGKRLMKQAYESFSMQELAEQL